MLSIMGRYSIFAEYVKCKMALPSNYDGTQHADVRMKEGL